jgi:hypothetical protein
MAEFYDELLNIDPIVDYDVDIIYPDGTKDEMYLETIPKRGDIIRGYIVDKIIHYKMNEKNECEARIELTRKEDFKK